MGLFKYDKPGGENISLPIYVTRKTADGETFSYSMPFSQSFKVILGLWANVVAWSVVGLLWSAIALVYGVVVIVNAVASLV